MSSGYLDADTLKQNISVNNDRGPITKRKFFWSGGGAAIVDIPSTTLCVGDLCPREIRVFKGGNLNVTYRDGTSEVIVGIPDGSVFIDGNWMSISATSSTAYNLYIGW